MDTYQYEITNITTSTATRLAYPQNNFTRMLLTNTLGAAVQVDLYVEDPALMPSAGQKYFILNQVVIPGGASLEIGEDGVTYFENNHRELFLRSMSPTGDLTVLIRK